MAYSYAPPSHDPVYDSELICHLKHPDRTHGRQCLLASKTAESQWLVGDKMTFADMAFVPYNFRLSELLSQTWDEVWEGTPHVRAWHERMIALPSWKRSMEIRARLMDEQGVQWSGVPKGINTFTDYEQQIAAKKAEGK